MAVGDSRLRVHGLRRLGVADASIMPRITSGNSAVDHDRRKGGGYDQARQSAPAAIVTPKHRPTEAVGATANAKHDHEVASPARRGRRPPSPRCLWPAAHCLDDVV